MPSTASTRPTPGRPPLLPRVPTLAVLLGTAVLLPLARVVWTVSGGSLRLQQAFTDDTYYYALIAENLAHGRGSTFGGLVPTNGYQPLWQLLMVPLAALADGDGLLVLLLVVVAVLFAGSVVLMWTIAHRLGAEMAGVHAIAYTVAVGLLAGNQFFSGMEIALVLPALLAFVAVAVAVARTPGVRTGLLLGTLALVVALARLDATAVPVLFGAVLLLRRRDRAALETVGAAGAVLGVGFAAYALVNLVAFGTALPVSGQAKAVGGGTLGAQILTDYLGYGSVGPLPVLLGVQSVLLAVAALVVLRRTTVFSTAADPQVAAALLACLLGQAAQLGYFTATSSYDFWPWYYYIVPVQLFLAVLVLGQVLLRSGPARRLATVPVALAVAAVALAVDLVAFLREPPDTDSWTAAAGPVAAWVRENSAPGDVVAMGDRAGYFTWLTRRPTLQLEGLVEDAAYLDVLREQRIADHMAQVGVRYYVRSVETDGTPPPESTGCTVVVEPLQGAGPKSQVPVCADGLVYRHVGPDFVWSVWEFRP